MKQTNQLKLTMKRILLVFMLILTGYAGGFAQAVDFKQAANKLRTSTGQVSWIGSILNDSKSDYYEGMAVPQRIILTGLTPNQEHTFYFSFSSIKANSHSYDFITSWDKAISVANFVGNKLTPGSSLLSDLISEQCGEAIPSNYVAVCTNATKSERVIIPSPPNPTINPSGSNIAAIKAAFENAFSGDTRLLIKSTQDISGATMTFEGYDGADMDGTYKLVWNSGTATTAVIQFAGHLALGAEPSRDWAGVGHGNNFGAGSVSGAPYHINLGRIDGSSLGNQDNQIQSPLILGCDQPTATAGVDQTICQGATASLTGDFGGSASSATWATSGTGTFSSFTNKTTVYTPSAADIAAGGVSLTYTTNVVGTCGSKSDAMVLTINKFPTTSVAGSDQTQCDNGSFTLAGNVPTVGTGVWSIVSGSATITTPSSATSGVSGLTAGSSVTLRWTISNGVCTASSSDVTLTNNALPSAPTAGDVTECFDGTEKTGSATAGTGETILWYTTAEGNVTASAPSRTEVGSSSAYAVAKNDVTGCEGSRTLVTVTINALPSAPTAGDVTECFDGTEKTGSATAGAGESIVWYDAATGGNVVSAPKLTAAGSASAYAAAKNDVTGCEGSRTLVTVTIKALPTFILTPTASPCLGAPEGKILVTSTSGNGFVVKLDSGSPINVPGSTYTFNNLFGTNVYSLTVTQNGCSATNTVTVNDGAVVCYPYYTYSQGYYGNTNGNGVACIRGEGGLKTRLFIERSLATGGGLKLGVAGSAKFFSVPNNGTALVNASAIDKLLLIMPGGGSPNLLAGLSILPLVAPEQLKNGKINNVLLGQAVAMWLNINIPGNELGSFDLKGLKCKTTIVTKGQSSASSCEKPYAGTTEVSTAFPQSVVNAMIGRGKTTVRDLVDFASEKLGSSDKNYGGVSLSDMNSALDAIVNAFHGGKYFARFDNTIAGCSLPTSKINVASPVENATAVKVENSNVAVVVNAFPNPYIDQVTFNVTVKNAGKGSLIICNMLGQKVANVFEGNMQANSTQTIRYNVPFAQRKNLVYVFRQNDITNTGKLVSGK